MEKYTTWTDQYTGVHPFLPHDTKIPTTIGFPGKLWYYIKWYLIGTALAIARLPFVLILFGLLFTFDTAFRYVPIGFVKRGGLRFLVGFLARLLLFVMGFWWIDVKYQQSKRKNPTPNQFIVGQHIGSGHVLLCNHTSYVELLYFAFRYMPQYTVVGADGKSLIEQDLWQSFNTTIGNIIPTASGKPLSQLVEDSEKRWLGPLVVFPEGITTNGKVLLGCLPVIDKPLPSWRVHLVSTSYDFYEFGPTFTVGNFLWHLFRLCGQISNKLEVKHVIDSDLPEAATTDDQVMLWADSLFSLLASAGNVRRAKITREVKVGFLEYWFGHKKTYKKNQ